MKSRLIPILGILAALGGAFAVRAQYNGAYVDNRATTPGQAAAYGMSEVVRSKGQYNLDTSAAAINMTQAQRNEIQNRESWTHTYFEMRKANKAYRDAEAGPRTSMEDLVRYAEAGKPKPLSPGELTPSGRILWPGALRTSKFTQPRGEVEQLFAERSTKGLLEGDDYMRLQTLTNGMLADLKSQISSLPPSDYTSAKSFLQSLAYEARRPAG